MQADHGLGRRQPDRRADRGRRGLRRAPAASVRFNFGASNVLARQIVSGAPVDVFISADEAQMDVVAAAGLVKEGTRVALLRNQLAIAVPERSPAHVQEHPRDCRPRVQADRDRRSGRRAGRRLREAVPGEGRAVERDRAARGAGRQRARGAGRGRIGRGRRGDRLSHRHPRRAARRRSPGSCPPTAVPASSIRPRSCRPRPPAASRSAFSTTCRAPPPRASSSASVSPRSAARMARASR